jgi:hypothetical protein
MVRYQPYSLACLILAVFSLTGLAGPVYQAVPTGSSELSEQLALETADQRLNKLAEAKLAQAKSDFLEAVAALQSGTTSSSKTAPYVANRSRRSTVDKPYIPSAKSTMRDTGFIPSFGYGPSFPNLGSGPSSASSPGSGMGGSGSGGNASLAQPGTFSQLASLSSGSSPGIGTSGSWPISPGSGPSSTDSGSGSATNGGQNGTSGGGQGVPAPTPGSGPTNHGDSSNSSSNSNNPVGSANGNSGGNGSPPTSGNGDPGPVVIPPSSDPPFVPSIAAVPEPPAIALCLIGVGGLLFVVAINRRNRR